MLLDFLIAFSVLVISRIKCIGARRAEGGLGEAGVGGKPKAG